MAQTIAAGEPAAERADPNCRDVMLESRLRHALARLNPDLPAEALNDAFRKLIRADAPSLIERNRAVHRMLVEGVTVECRRPMGLLPVTKSAYSTSTLPRTTTGWRLTSSPLPRANISADRTWWYSSTDCRWQ